MEPELQKGGFKHRVKQFFHFLRVSVVIFVLMTIRTAWFMVRHPRRAFMLVLYVAVVLLAIFWAAYFFGLSPTLWPLIPDLMDMIFVSVFVVALFAIFFLFKRRKRQDHSTEA